MAFLYNRMENEKEIIITYKYLPYFYISMILVFIVSIIDSISFLFFPLLLIISGLYITGTWKIRKEIKKAIRTNGVKVDGSKFSFKNPLKVIIKK